MHVDRKVNGILEGKVLLVAFIMRGMNMKAYVNSQAVWHQLQLVICTSAFGMGVNKANTRYIIHFIIQQYSFYLQKSEELEEMATSSYYYVVRWIMITNFNMGGWMPSKSQIQFFIFFTTSKNVFNGKNYQLEDVARNLLNASKI